MEVGDSSKAVSMFEDSMNSTALEI